MTTTETPKKVRESLPVGSLWAFPATSGDRVQVLTPGEIALTVVATDGAVLVVLTEPGVWTSGEHSVTAQA